MSDGFSFDFSELNKLAADLGEVPKNIGPNLNSALQFTATRIKKDAKKSVGKKYWSAAAAAIDYDIGTGGGSAFSAVAGVLSGAALASEISAEIGYNKGKAGGDLGNLREFGAPKRDLAPSNDLLNALHANEADFQKGIGKASADAERKAGL